MNPREEIAHLTEVLERANHQYYVLDAPEMEDYEYDRLLRRMEELSIYVDVSHLSDAGFWDVVRLSRRPVVASHSNSRAVCPHRRNLTDDMFRAIRDSGGVAGLNYYQHFVGDDPTMEGLVRHVEHF